MPFSFAERLGVEYRPFHLPLFLYNWPLLGHDIDSFVYCLRRDKEVKAGVGAGYRSHPVILTTFVVVCSFQYPPEIQPLSGYDVGFPIRNKYGVPCADGGGGPTGDRFLF